MCSGMSIVRAVRGIAAQRTHRKCFRVNFGLELNHDSILPAKMRGYTQTYELRSVRTQHRGTPSPPVLAPQRVL